MSKIVIVGESAADAKAVKGALRKAGIKNSIRWIDDGTDAINYLEAAAEIPTAVFLDMKLPGLTGLEILDRLRDSASFEKTLRIVFSGVEVLGPLKEAYRRGAHSYLTKPVSAIEVANLMKTFGGHWMTRDSSNSSKRLSAPRRTTSHPCGVRSTERGFEFQGASVVSRKGSAITSFVEAAARSLPRFEVQG